MEHKEILKAAYALMGERGKEYGQASENFQRAAEIATLIMGKEISRYDIATAMIAVKLARLHASRDKADTYLDIINYTAFAGEFTGPATVATLLDP